MDELCDTDRLLRLLPPIRRARLWRLYAEDGRRFLDLWMDGGRAILGAKGTGIGTVAKAAVDVGLTRPFPSIRERRLEREISSRWPAYAALRFYRDESRALAALARAFGEGGGTDDLVFDPARRVPVANRARALVLRSFADALVDAGTAAGDLPAAIPVLPSARVFAPTVVLFKEAGKAALAGEGDLVPPLLLATVSRSFRELDRFAQTYDEGLWRRVDRRLESSFERRGPYLYPRRPREQHERFFRAALGAGVLLSPDPDLPCMIPGDFDDGELARLAKALG